MSDDYVETIRAGIEAFNRRDFDAAVRRLRDDVTWERFLSRAEATTPLVDGKEELLATWRSQVDAVDLKVEPLEFIGGGDTVIVPLRMVTHGSASSIELADSVTWAWRFDESGLIFKVEVFDSVDDAITSAETESSAPDDRAGGRSPGHA